MRGVERTVLTARAMPKAGGAAVAQAAVVLSSAVLFAELPPVPLPPRAKSSHAVIERIMSFDGNADHRISRNELPERMHGLVARGDSNADAALDSNEIRALVIAASSERKPVSIRTQSSEGLPGVIKDLRLPPAKDAVAFALISANKLSRNIDDPTGNFYAEMKALLDDEEYENFVAAAARLSRLSRSMRIIR